MEQTGHLHKDDAGHLNKDDMSRSRQCDFAKGKSYLSPTSLSFQSSSETPLKQIDKQVPLHVICLDFQKAFHKTLNSSKEFKDNEQP